MANVEYDTCKVRSMGNARLQKVHGNRMTNARSTWYYILQSNHLFMAFYLSNMHEILRESDLRTVYMVWKLIPIIQML
jgi:hypothetical protein